VVCEAAAIDASALGRSKLWWLAWRARGWRGRCILGGGEEEEGRRVAEGERRGQGGQGKSADQCLRHDDARTESGAR
jgi:hypothetical protein